jgi:hypothetical protein
MKNKNLIKLGLFLSMLALVVLPFVSFAQTGTEDWPDASQHDAENNGGGGNSCSDIYNGEGGFEGLVDYFGCILARSVVPVLFALALVVFLWGVTQFIMNSADENKRAQGKQFMVWGIIGLFVMFSVWGLVLLLQATINPGQDKLFIPSLPQQQ